MFRPASCLPQLLRLFVHPIEETGLLGGPAATTDTHEQQSAHQRICQHFHRLQGSEHALGPTSPISDSPCSCAALPGGPAAQRHGAREQQVAGFRVRFQGPLPSSQTHPSVLRCQAGLLRSDTAPVSNSPHTNTAARPGAAPSPFQPVGPSLFAPAPGGGGAGGNAGGLLFPGSSPFSAALPGGHGSAGERAGAGAGAPAAQGLGGEGWHAGSAAAPAQGLGEDRPHGSREDRPHGSGGAGFSGGGQGLVPRASGGRSGSGGMTYASGGQGPGEDRPHGSGGAGFGGGGQGLVPRASGGGSGGAAPASRLPPLSPAGGGRSAQALRASAATLTPVPEVADHPAPGRRAAAREAAAVGRRAAGAG